MPRHCAQYSAILSLFLCDHSAESAMCSRAVVPLMPHRDRRGRDVPLSRHRAQGPLQICDDQRAALL